MNEHDKQNLEFLLTASPEGIQAWLDQASDDDIAYANELLIQGKIEATMELARLLDLVEVTDDAEDVLQKFRINK